MTHPPISPVNGDGAHDPQPGQFTSELRDTQRSARALIALVDHDALKDLSGGTEVLDALAAFENASIPTARQLARAALVGAIEGTGIYMLWNRARRAFMAAAPSVMDMFLEKMEKGAACPYSERLLVESMKGMGMLQQSEPIDDAARTKMLTSDEVQELTDDELRERLHKQTVAETS